ncbi:MAG: flagellar hook-basal body complex protein FliE [Chloroflexi bacterium]|nr:flagellar hook-basal body complex protein FliE [Chloroflexota bacterium]
MDIAGVRIPIGSIPSVGTGGSAAAGRVVNSFGEALLDAVQSLDQVQKVADSTGLALAAGEPVELHEVMLAQDRANLDFSLAVQVRNKLVDAYQEIMRMQI